jgi:hypothetical protein
MEGSCSKFARFITSSAGAILFYYHTLWFGRRPAVVAPAAGQKCRLIGEGQSANSFGRGGCRFKSCTQYSAQEKFAALIIGRFFATMRELLGFRIVAALTLGSVRFGAGEVLRCSLD